MFSMVQSPYSRSVVGFNSWKKLCLSCVTLKYAPWYMHLSFTTHCLVTKQLAAELAYFTSTTLGWGHVKELYAAPPWQKGQTHNFLKTELLPVSSGLYIVPACRPALCNFCFGSVTCQTYKPSWLVRILSDVIVIQLPGWMIDPPKK